jgi:hypothetical protein
VAPACQRGVGGPDGAMSACPMIMKKLGEAIQKNVSEIVTEWETMIRQQPWYSLPEEDRLEPLPAVIMGLVDAALCRPDSVEAHRANVEAAANHGRERRRHGVPEYLMFTEYHLIRQAIWYFVVRTFGASEYTAAAIMRIDGVISTSTNAAMWGYHREEIEGLGKWAEGIEGLVRSAQLVSTGQDR